MTPIQVRVVRPSQVGTPVLVSTGARGVVLGAVAVTHRDLITGRPAPSQASPVRLERYTGGRWVLAAVWTTGRDGIARGQVTLPPGVHQVRAVRPAGDTVTGATSPLMRVEVVPGLAGAAVPA